MSVIKFEDSETDVNLVEPTDAVNSELVDPKNVHRLHEPNDLVELAKSIKTSREFVKSQAFGKLSIIAEQMKFLEMQARKVLEKAKFDDELHLVSCNFQKIPGKIYYLYSKPDQDKETRFFSLISPEEWGPKCPNKFLGAYRLEHDRSWTADEEISRVNYERTVIENVLNKRSIYEAIKN